MRKCISYLTIERKTDIPDSLAPMLGDWLFGCDICQEVCPWNRRPLDPPAQFPHNAMLEQLDLFWVLSLSEAEFRQHFRGTAIFRTKRRGLVRTAAILLGNRRDPRAIPRLRLLLDDAEIVVRQAAAWAIERIESDEK